MARLRACSWFAFALTTVALSACSGTTGHKLARDTIASPFPMTIADDGGTVTVPQLPHRIVSVSATATEDLYALGAGGQVVAVDAYSTFPPQAPRTKLTESSLNIEAIAKYQPDLVVMAEDTNHIVAQLRKLGIPALVEPPASNLASAYQEIDQLGRASGHPAGAARVIGRMRDEIAAIVRSTPRPKKPLHVYHELEPTFYSATSHTFVGQIYSMLGLRNIADAAHLSGPYPQLSDEYIIAADPSLIVLADTVCCKQTAAAVAGRAGWRDIAAIKGGAVLAVNDAIASQWGPRIVVFARTVASTVKRIEQREAPR